jgi:hypothetical protein
MNSSTDDIVPTFPCCKCKTIAYTGGFTNGVCRCGHVYMRECCGYIDDSPEVFEEAMGLDGALLGDFEVGAEQLLFGAYPERGK